LLLEFVSVRFGFALSQIDFAVFAADEAECVIVQVSFYCGIFVGGFDLKDECVSDSVDRHVVGSFGLRM
jgi:hypothetical protein